MVKLKFANKICFLQKAPPNKEKTIAQLKWLVKIVCVSSKAKKLILYSKRTDNKKIKNNFLRIKMRK